jgi:hypothetical protein
MAILAVYLMLACMKLVRIADRLCRLVPFLTAEADAIVC